MSRAIGHVRNALKDVGGPAPSAEAVEGRPEIVVRVPSDLIDPNAPASHMAQVLMEVVRSVPVKCRVSSIEVPPDLFAGPKVGLQGIRKLTGTRGPLLGVVIRSESSEPFDQAKKFYELAVAGADIGVETPFLLDQPFSPLSARVSHAADMVDRVREEVGRRVIYAVSVDTRSDALMSLVESAADAGISCVALGSPTFEAIEAIARSGHRVAVYVRGGAMDPGLSWASPEAAAALLRLAGADVVERPSAGWRLGRSEISSIDSALLGKLVERAKKSLPAAVGMVHPGSVETNVLLFGTDQALMFDEGVYGHPWGCKSGVIAARAALDAALRGEGFYEAVEGSEELKLAADRWGYLPPDEVP